MTRPIGKQGRMDFDAEPPRREPPGYYDLYGGTPPHSNESIRPVASKLALAVLEHIREAGGATCHEVEAGLKLAHQTASARIRELAQRDEVRDSGVKRPTPSGRMAIVWEASEGS
jgi:predicted transcriptional regulator